MKQITSKCEYVAPAIEVINVVDMDTLLAGSDPDVTPGGPDVEPGTEDEWEEIEG